MKVMPKHRSKLGKWIDKEGRSQEWLIEHSKVSRNTISEICAGKRNPSFPTIQKIMKTIKKVDKKAKTEDFFDI